MIYLDRGHFHIRFEIDNPNKYTSIKGDCIWDHNQVRFVGLKLVNAKRQKDLPFNMILSEKNECEFSVSRDSGKLNPNEMLLCAAVLGGFPQSPTIEHPKGDDHVDNV